MAEDDSPDTNYWRGYLTYKLEQFKKPHEPHKIAADILVAYGGMGTLSDVNLYKNEEPAPDEINDKFSALRTKLFEACEEVIIVVDL